MKNKGIVVDGACSGNPGLSKYRGLDLETGEIVFSTFLGHSTNNICEFVALCHGIGYALNNNQSIIYSDSTVALSWVKKKAINSSIRNDMRSVKSVQFVGRSIQFLNTLEIVKNENGFTVNKKLSVRLWKTSKWGENPADYGHKQSFQRVYKHDFKRKKLSLSEIGNKIKVPADYYENIKIE